MVEDVRIIRADIIEGMTKEECMKMNYKAASVLKVGE